MKGYAIFTLHSLHDAQAMSDYRKHALASMKKYGARVRVARGRQEVLEGGPNLASVVIEFDSFEQALTWYRSAEYQESKALRENAADISAVIVEGLPE